MLDKIKGYFWVILIVLIATASFGLGRLTKIEDAREPVKIESVESGQVRGESVRAEGRYVASRNGTKYHLPWCDSAKRIKEENKIWFDSKQAAEAAGYTPAATCPGI